MFKTGGVGAHLSVFVRVDNHIPSSLEAGKVKVRLTKIDLGKSTMMTKWSRTIFTHLTEKYVGCLLAFLTTFLHSRLCALSKTLCLIGSTLLDQPSAIFRKVS